MDYLKPGSIEDIVNPNKENPKTIYLQAHQSKTIPESEGERVRLMLNDGKFTVNGLFKPSPEQPHIENFQKCCVLAISQYAVAPTNGGKVFIVIDAASVVGVADKPDLSKFELIDKYLEKTNSGVTTRQEGAFATHSNDFDETSPAPPARRQQKKKYNNLYSIDQLSPYQNNWTIKARVSYKSDVRTWSNQRGDGKLFNVNLLDETSEIRATGFNQVVDKFYDVLQENKVYYISKCAMQMAKPQFSNLKHQYELQFDKDSIIEPCDSDDQDDVPKLRFDFVQLDQIQNLQANAVIDTIGVLKEVQEHRAIVSKSTGKPFDRRDIVIVDDSHFAISVGLWNKQAVEFDFEPGCVLAFKGGRVHEYNGTKSLSLSNSSLMTKDPDLPEAYKLKGWFDNEGKSEQFKSYKGESSGNSNLSTKDSIFDRKTIQQVNDLKLGFNEKPDYFNLKATLSFIKTDNFSYPACQNTDCNRKVTEQSDGSWRCEKCDKSFPTPLHRYMLTISVVDSTGQLWLSLFDEQARQLVGMSADELLVLKDDSENDNKLKNFVNDNISFNEFSFRVRARLDSYQGVDRARFNVFGLARIDYSLEADALCDMLEKADV